ncbi:MAG: transcriptional regulator, BadM/Rrf2 family [Sphingomonadales bacterium]|nr:transcriptional regulator, BadM/Rrf2 family [Sphingomonadales bacterium]
MLSQQSRYALKALIHLATKDPLKPHPIVEIAAACNIPRKFLEAILLDLKFSGLVHSTRGKAGGYALSRLPKEITFGEIIRATDGPLALLHCASKKFYRRCLDCPDEEACALRRIMTDARDQLSAVLDHRTLADALSFGFDGPVHSAAPPDNFDKEPSVAQQG